LPKTKQQAMPLSVTVFYAVDKLLYFYDSGNMEEQIAVTSLAALAQSMRLRIFRALVGAAPLGLTPSALCATLDVPASTLSFHLKELTHAGLVSQERDGRNLIYKPSLAHMNALLAYLTAHCCQGASCATTTVPDCTSC
jgi:ArsR family transcriptional regulator, arsenate/arsenite/antimonite-responsive transcriptional repressor